MFVLNPEKEIRENELGYQPTLPAEERHRRCVSSSSMCGRKKLGGQLWGLRCCHTNAGSVGCVIQWRNFSISCEFYNRRKVDKLVGGAMCVLRWRWGYISMQQSAEVLLVETWANLMLEKMLKRCVAVEEVLCQWIKRLSNETYGVVPQCRTGSAWDLTRKLKVQNRVASWCLQFHRNIFSCNCS